MTYLNIEEHGESICDHFLVIDMDTGEELNRCTWANDDTGEYSESSVENGVINNTLKKANIKLVYKGSGILI